ncbi:MAG: hypothetical protein KKG09_09015 [Verrucomicrobia bacterium]|nr:hypothetical protein [Verrucomicrobiota bacterium]MBU4429358.1 hypothetical protein [Verrucomicrobiota bacterium]MBU4498129.1 hypothetical protein [Verrucomicrobiota bacterium]MCG2680109.1 hypothetical protein [Kiritimatiellia bacterium]
MPYKLLVLWFAVLCLIMTAFLLIWPNMLIRANSIFKRWISTESLEKQLNRTHDIDSQLLAWHKIIGLITLLLSVIFIVLLIW